MVGEAFASLGRSIGGTSTTNVQGTATGARGTTVLSGSATTRDQAVNNAITTQNMNAISNSGAQEKAARLSGAMLANTIFRGASAGGRVHYKRETNAKLLTLCVPVEHRVLCIPLEPTTK